MNFNEVELVIFDLDGTLIDSSVDIANACNHALKNLGIAPWPVEQIKGMIGRGSKALVHKALAGREEHFPEAFKLFSEHYRSHLLDYTRLYDGVSDLIASLSDRSLAIMSNKRQAYCDPIVDGLDLRPHFRLVVGGDTPKRQKPHPEAIEYVCEKAGIPANKTVMIGDSPVDIEAGKAAGAFTIGLTSGFCSGAEVIESRPDLIVSTASELLKTLSLANPQKP